MNYNNEIIIDYEFFDNCSSLCDAARKIFGRDNYRDCEKIKKLCDKYGFDWKIWQERRKPKIEVAICPNCGKEFERITGRSYTNKFCSRSCSSSYNNKKKGNKPFIEHTVCKYCGKDLYKKHSKTKYCSWECQHKYEQEEYIKRWKNGDENGLSGRYGISARIRTYLFEKFDSKCQVCGWGEENKKTHKIPLQIHHIDGDCTNNKEENLQLLCPNCHSLTETFGNLNHNSKRIFRKQKDNKP